MFITDSYAIANALVNVADGHLAVRHIQYSLTFGSQPGLYVSDETVYGRNYAHVFLSLPVLWLLEGITTIFDLRLVLAAGWSLLVFTLFKQVGRVFERHQQLSLFGCGVALVTFLGSTTVATLLSEKWLAFIALQLTAMFATAFVGVTLYRLLSRIHGRRVGALIGLATVVASPVGFWASIPKRHVLTVLSVVGLLGLFYASRAATTGRQGLLFRALAYAIIAYRCGSTRRKHSSFSPDRSHLT